jgi:hypothetical protein
LSNFRVGSSKGGKTMKLPECFGCYGLTDDCYGCAVADECEEETEEAIEELEMEEEDC